LDILVAGRVLIEIKAVERLAPVHHAQVMCYLRVSTLRVALLMNFNSAVLPDGLKRIIL
jgi:GxxExxY protein